MEDRSPYALLKDPNAVAKVLSISDQHVAILLTRSGSGSSSGSGSGNGSDDDRTIIQLTVRPFHKDRLPKASMEGGNVDKGVVSEGHEKDDSEKILRFLSQYDFTLTSESGQEYRYYDANPKSSIVVGALSRIQSLLGIVQPEESSALGSMQSTIISPATDRQVSRATPATMSLVNETPEMYNTVTKPYIESVVESGSTGWVMNVVTKQKETERILLDADEYLLNIDTKWRSHPDPKSVPREEWFDHPSVADLYCLAIVKDPKLMSLRDLNARHLPMLRAMVRDCPPVIEKVYGVKADQIRVFVHYHPQFYHMHVHFTRLHNEVGSTVERGHLVSDIIQNLEMDGEYYAKRTVSFKLKVTDKLYNLLFPDH